MLKKEGIKHEVLNAKFHEKEAEIVAQAGKFGSVTIATNMAGRGTDIMLGGNSEFLAKQEMRKLQYNEDLIEQATAFNETDDKEILDARAKFKELESKFDAEIKEEKEKVIQAGGLKIIGTERHESRRIDNQLRGRSGRQGDPGESRFYIGLDDDLMKIFGGDKVTAVYNMLGADENMPIEAKMISKSVETAQKRVEGRNFSIRKNVLSYDDVMNVQREVIYAQRRQVLDGEDLKDKIIRMMDSVAEDLVNVYLSEDPVNKEALMRDIETTFAVSSLDSLNEERLNGANIVNELLEKIHSTYAQKEVEFGSEELRELERVVMLKIVDQKWMDHIDDMDELKNGIGLQGYGQKDPVVQYRIIGGEMFDEMNANIKVDVTRFLLNARKREGGIHREEQAQITNASLEDAAISLVDGSNLSKEEGGINKTVVNTEPKIGRNDPCPCGSGKKYKNCHGKNA